MEGEATFASNYRFNMVLKSVSVNDAERARNSVCMDSLKTWILSEGGKVQKVKTCTTSPRRFVAAEQINGSDSNGQPISSIPISCLMHPALAKSDPKYGSTLTKLANEHGVDDRTILTLFLALEKGRGDTSRWATYVRTLPETISIPLNWTKDELMELAGTRLEKAVMEHHEALKKQAEKWAPLLLSYLRQQQRDLTSSQLNEEIHEEDFLWAETALAPDRIAWARSCVWSRAFSLYIRRKKTVALVPLGDMLDHSPHSQVEWRTDDAAGMFSIVSYDNVPIGSEIYNNYGAKSNAELLLGYGFVLEKNEADTLNIQLATNDLTDHGNNDHLSDREYRDDLMKYCGVNKSFSLRADDPMPDSLLLAASVVLMSPSDAYRLPSEISGDLSPQEILNHDMVRFDLCTAFRVAQTLQQLFSDELERLQIGRPLASNSQERVRPFIARMSAVHRESQIKIARAALVRLSAYAQQLVTELSRAERERLASSAGTQTSTPVENIDHMQSYQRWEDSLGIDREIVQELQVRRNRDVLGCGVGGLRLLSRAFEGDELGAVPIHSFITAGKDIKEISKAVGTNREEAALAATLLDCATEPEDGEAGTLGPFARLILASPSGASSFEIDVLTQLATTPLGQEALRVREGYDNELAALFEAGWTYQESKIEGLRGLYAKARIVVDRYAFRLPEFDGKCGVNLAGCLALVPFIGFLPRSLHEVVGRYSWKKEDKPKTGLNTSSGMQLQLTAVCQVEQDSLLVEPMDGMSEEQRILDFGFGCSTFAPVSGHGSLLKTDSTRRKPAIDKTLFQQPHNMPTEEVIVDLEPTGEDVSLAKVKYELLRMMGVGNTHYITLSTSPSKFCVALAVYCAETQSELDAVKAEWLKGVKPTESDFTCVGNLDSTAKNSQEADIMSPETRLLEPRFGGDHVNPRHPLLNSFMAAKILKSGKKVKKCAQRQARTLLKLMLRNTSGMSVSDAAQHIHKNTVDEYLMRYREILERNLELLTPKKQELGKRARREIE